MAGTETTGLLVECRDEPGVLYRITEAIFRHGANITYVAGGAARRETIAELQLEVSGVPEQAQMIADLEEVRGVTKVSKVPTFQTIYGKRVIVIGGGAQVGMVAQGAISEPAAAESLNPNFSIYSGSGNAFASSRPMASQPYNTNAMAEMSTKPHRAHRAPVKH